ncbi:MAG TPA: hypothetical protein VG276_28135 [Actinomycetes bacterium]|jgi:hypothetical protein|nr:hypothetical protein [Actinomycetes bacterium]
MNLCGLSQPSQPKLPDAGQGTCCYGAACMGPERCTCWEPVFEVEQTPPDSQTVTLLAAGVQPVTRQRPCDDCAYRPDSPERRGDPNVAGDQELLEQIVQRGERFWCHQGIRRPIAWRHPAGVQIPGSPVNYQPPIIDGVPYRADGTPAEVCAGWAARRRALETPERQP